MTATAANTDDLRLEAARLAVALLRFDEGSAHLLRGVLLEFDDESHVFSFAAVREWSQQFPVQVQWSIWPLEGDSRADARMMIRRSDGGWFRGRSCMEPSDSKPPEPSIGAA